MNFLRIITVAIILCIGTFASSQTVITINDDTVFDETLVFNEDTILEGVGVPNVSFNGTPKFEVNNCRVLVKNMRIADKRGWGTIGGNNGILEWYGIGMEGSITLNDSGFDTFLDGQPK